MGELLHRAVRVLDVLRVADDGLSIRQVAQRAALSKSTVQRLLRDLVATDLARQDPVTRRYRLGPRTLALGVAYQRRLDVRQVSLPYMAELRDDTGETVGLSVGYGDQILHIEQVESLSELKATFEIGRPLPLWSGAPSRVLLADRPDAQIRDIIARREQTDLRPVNPPAPDALLDDVRRVRRVGYAVAVEETLPGVSTLAAPVRGSTGETVATLSLTSPATRLTDEAIENLLPQLTGTARAISQELGWVPYRR